MHKLPSPIQNLPWVSLACKLLRSKCNSKGTKMRKLLLCCILAGFTLAGCTAAQIEQSAATIEGEIQSGAAALCGVVPTISSILAVVGAVTGSTEITTIANTGIAAIE